MNILSFKHNDSLFKLLDIIFYCYIIKIKSSILV